MPYQDTVLKMGTRQLAIGHKLLGSISVWLQGAATAFCNVGDTQQEYYGIATLTTMIDHALQECDWMLSRLSAYIPSYNKKASNITCPVCRAPLKVKQMGNVGSPYITLQLTLDEHWIQPTQPTLWEEKDNVST